MWKMETERKDTVNRREARRKGNDGYNTVFPRDIVCLGNISINTLHKGDDDDDDNNIFNCKWTITRWQWLLCLYINMK
jgi:hypothetical protein